MHQEGFFIWVKAFLKRWRATALLSFEPGAGLIFFDGGVFLKK